MRVKLGDVVQITSSNMLAHPDHNWLLNLDMVEQKTGNVIDYKYVPISELGGSIISFDTDVVLYSKLRPNLNKVVLPQMIGYATSEMLPLKPNNELLLREYLAEFLRSDSFVTWAVSKTAGAKMPRLGTKELLSKEMPLPSLEEQKNMVAKLDKISDLIAMRKKQLQKLDVLVKSRFVEMFGDLTGNQRRWDTFTLEECFDITSSKRILKSEWKAKGIPFLRVRDMVQLAATGKTESEFFVSEEFYASLNDSDGIPQQGDILMSATSTLGKCHVVSKGERFYFKDADVLRFRPRKEMNPRFFMEEMKTAYIQEQISRTLGITTVAHFTIKAAKTIYMRYPRIELQDEFASLVEQTDKSKSTIQQSLDKLELLKKALMQKYFG